MAFSPIRSTLAAILALALGACSGMSGDRGGGLAHIGAVKRGDNLYDVVYLGRDAASPAYRRDMALLQSAELCKARGFAWFKASDTSAYSNFAAPDKPAAEAPQLTLQVSCYPTSDAAAVTYGTDQVIGRVKAAYSSTAF